MAPTDTASAIPANLITYADHMKKINDALYADASLLSAALGTFASSCREFDHGVGSSLANDLRTYVHHFAPVDEWVREVGHDFASADNGIPAWATAPFAAAGVLPRRVRIPGKRGVVPPGYANAGSRLYLYMGRFGTDTVFGIHPPKNTKTGKAPKPTVRLDYGPIYTKAGTAPLPNGGATPVRKGPNYLHWNQQGNMGTVNKPLMRTLGGGPIRDHQLITNKTTPRANVMGPLPGGTLVRGASRGFFVAGAALDTYNIATADNKVKESVRVAAGWGGAWAGAKGGAMAGAAIGSIFPGPGAAIGAVAGGLIGGAIGYAVGSGLGEKLYEAKDSIINGIKGWFD
jgi:hypothetical protein